MQQIAVRVNSLFVPLWIRYRRFLFPLAILLMAIAGSIRLWNEYGRLLFDPSWFGANDLTTFYNAVHGWFAGRNIYAEPRSAAAYPPATFIILWPVLGWLNFTQARVLFAFLTLPCLAILSAMLISQSRASSKWEKLFVVVLLLSMNATGVTIGNGQITLLILCALIGGILLNSRRTGSATVLMAAILLIIALAKPSITAAFLWIYLLQRPPWKQKLLILAGYLALTVIALQFQPYDPATMLKGWLSRGSLVATEGGPSAYGNLHTWLAAAGLNAWIVPASLAAFALLGFWTFAHREADLWLLIGVAAIFARLWTYHRIYDDLLILLPMLALFRFSKTDGDFIAGFLLAFAVVLNLARMNDISPLRYMLLTNLHVLMWIAMLLFFHVRAKRRWTP